MSADWDDHKKLLGIPEGHSLRRTGGGREERKGQDTDIDVYEHLDADGNVVAKYEVRDSTSIYPPSKRSVTHRKID